VACGASQRRPDDPAARYLGTLRRRSAAVVAPEPARSTVGTVPALVAAGLLALLPVAAGIGILVGRGGGGNDEVLVEALKAQKVQVVQAGSGTADAGDVAAAEASESSGDAAKDDDEDAVTAAESAKPIVTTGAGGAARRTEGFKPTKKDLEESKAALQRVESTKGKPYVESQKNLPDQIIIP
jgi:hypothetical protein